jgi:hypothetical protein
MILVCDEVFEIYLIYIERFLCLAGIISNGMCVIAFLNPNVIQNYPGNMYKYLLFKSFCDLYICLRKIFVTYYWDDCEDCFLKRTKELCIFNLIFLNYLGFCALLLSMTLEISLNLDRYKTISNRLKFLDKASFRFKLTVLISICLLSNIFIFFDFKCQSVKSENTTELLFLTVIKNNTNSTEVVRIFINGIIRDGFCVLIIVILNILTISFVRKSFLYKKSVLNSCTVRYQTSKNEKSQKNINNMIITSSLVTVLGHLMSLISYIITFWDIYDLCYLTVDNFLFHISYSINFFIYYIFNKNFKYFFKSRLIKIIKFLTCRLINISFEFDAKTSMKIHDETKPTKF